jgi:hypothetical protein
VSGRASVQRASLLAPTGPALLPPNPPSISHPLLMSTICVKADKGKCTEESCKLYAEYREREHHVGIHAAQKQPFAQQHMGCMSDSCRLCGLAHPPALAEDVLSDFYPIVSKPLC